VQLRSSALSDDPLAPEAEPVADVLPSEGIERLDGVYREHADFVWRCLQRLGVPEADRPDLLHEIFLVVQRKLPSFESRSRMSTWLYGIAFRVASNQRRRVARRRESSIESAEEAVLPDTPEAQLERRQLAARLDSILDRLPLDKRAVFVMFEVEELTCDEIAEISGVPVGTVHSRLHHARKLFQRALERDERKRGNP
jgi:RNA polymerase sigma-70 factor (ECF subfamily)